MDDTVINVTTSYDTDIKKIICKQDNVASAIDMDYLYKWSPQTPVFISAQTGSGKNTFIKKTLIEKLIKLNFRFLIMSNRIALSRQEKKSIARLLDKIFSSSSYEDEVNKYGTQMIDELESFGNITIKSYQSFLSRREKLLNNYDFVIFDECHFFLADAKFNKSTYTILINILQRYPNAIRIYMSATPEDVIRPIINVEQQQYRELENNLRFNPFISRFLPVHEFLWQQNLDLKCNEYTLKNHNAMNGFDKCDPIHKFAENIQCSFLENDSNHKNFYETFETFNNYSAVVYELKRNYDYLDCKYLSSAKKNKSNLDDNQIKQYQPLIDLIKKQIEIEKKTNKIEKWLIFTGKKVIGQKLLDLIGSHYATYIDSTSKYSGKEDEKVYNKICEEGIFDKKVLITTAILDNGISIIDSQVKHIAVLIFDITSFLQMIGRRRIKKEEKITLYIQEFQKESLIGLLKIANDNLNKINIANNNSMEIIKQIINNDKIFFYNNNQKHNLNNLIGYNEFLRIKLINDIAFFNKILKDSSEIDNFDQQTIIEQLSWLK